MELLSWQQWLTHGLLIISMAAVALSLWPGREMAVPKRTRYFKLLAGLLMVPLVVAYLVLLEPPMPLAFRVLHYLLLVLLVILAVGGLRRPAP